jgi:hypothetical protein
MNDIVWSADPRPDLQSDSTMWGTMLGKAFAIDGHNPDGLFGPLHGLRCLGAGLSVPTCASITSHCTHPPAVCVVPEDGKCGACAAA